MMYSVLIVIHQGHCHVIRCVAGLGAILLVLDLAVQSAWASAPARLSTAADYTKYIDQLLSVPDFGIEYYEDGAADASVLWPQISKPPYGNLKPAAPVKAILELKTRALPLLIDCLADARLTNAVFGGNKITNRMKVPVGYVCLDILMGIVPGKPVADPDCADDGLGACMNPGFFFRPDDYYSCGPNECIARPWVLVVQKNWRAQYRSHRLRFKYPPLLR